MFKGYKRVVPAVGGAERGRLLMHARVSTCFGGGSEWLQAEGSIKTPLPGWDAEESCWAGIHPKITKAPWLPLPFQPGWTQI